MKKVTALALALVLCLSLCACSQSEEAKAAQEAISQIGEVTYSSGSAITAAEELFNNLTAEEQASVKNADDLTAARAAYDALVTEPINKITGYLSALDAAVVERDFITCYASIDAIRNEMNGMEPELYEIVAAVTTDDEGNKLLDNLDDYEAVIKECCVNDTYLAQPGYVVTIESQGFWLVNDHGDFAAYNWWATDADDVDDAYEQYKEYVSKFVEINDTGSSFTFLDNSGNTVTVLCNITGDNGVLQVRVPRF